MVNKIKNLYKRLVNIWNITGKYEELSVNYEELLQKKWKIEAEKSYTYDDFIQKVISRDIKWIDYTLMTDTALSQYYSEAQQLINNRVFTSLFGGRDNENRYYEGELVKNVIQDIATKSRCYEDVEKYRMIIGVIESVRNYVYKIPNSVTTSYSEEE